MPRGLPVSLYVPNDIAGAKENGQRKTMED